MIVGPSGAYFQHKKKTKNGRKIATVARAGKKIAHKTKESLPPSEAAERFLPFSKLRDT